MKSWHVAVAAEAVAAALFARCGLDVSVQYGANQPEYDLMVARGEKVMKVSVKGSQDEGWGLTQSHLKKGTADYHGAIDLWLLKHTPKTVLCLIQFAGVSIEQLPRVYLATPSEIGEHLRRCKKGKGETILWEERRWGAKSFAAGTVDRIPPEWKFSAARVDALLRSL